MIVAPGAAQIRGFFQDDKTVYPCTAQLGRHAQTAHAGAKNSYLDSARLNYRASANCNRHVILSRRDDACPRPSGRGRTIRVHTLINTSVFYSGQ